MRKGGNFSTLIIDPSLIITILILDWVLVLRSRLKCFFFLRFERKYLVIKFFVARKLILLTRRESITIVKEWKW